MMLRAGLVGLVLSGAVNASPENEEVLINKPLGKDFSEDYSIEFSSVLNGYYEPVTPINYNQPSSISRKTKEKKVPRINSKDYEDFVVQGRKICGHIKDYMILSYKVNQAKKILGNIFEFLPYVVLGFGLGLAGMSSSDDKRRP